MVTDKETQQVHYILFSQEDLDMLNFLMLIPLKKHMNNLMEQNLMVEE